MSPLDSNAMIQCWWTLRAYRCQTGVCSHIPPFETPLLSYIDWLGYLDPALFHSSRSCLPFCCGHSCFCIPYRHSCSLICILVYIWCRWFLLDPRYGNPQRRAPRAAPPSNNAYTICANYYFWGFYLRCWNVRFG